MTNSVTETHSGPAWILAGDFTQAAAAGVKEIGLVLNASCKVEFWRTTTKNELGQIISDGIYGVVQGATVTLSMMKNSAEILASLVSDFTDETTAIGANTGLTTITPFSVAIVPQHVKSAKNAETSLGVQWLPKMFTVDVGEFIHRIEKSGTDDDSNPFQVTLQAALALTDQASQALAEGGRIWFRGDPTKFITPASPSKPWNLPSDYQS